MNLGMGELALILVIAFVVVGPRDLPKIARALARLMRQCKGLYAGLKDSLDLDGELEDIKRSALAAQPEERQEAQAVSAELGDIRREIARLNGEKVS